MDVSEQTAQEKPCVCGAVGGAGAWISFGGWTGQELAVGSVKAGKPFMRIARYTQPAHALVRHVPPVCASAPQAENADEGADDQDGSEQTGQEKARACAPAGGDCAWISFVRRVGVRGARTGMGSVTGSKPLHASHSAQPACALTAYLHNPSTF